MLQTPLGEIRFYENGVLKKYRTEALALQGKIFRVDARYRVDVIFDSQHDNVIECLLKGTKEFESGPNTGEDLALMSFESGQTILSVGFLGDLPQVNYDYLADRIRVSIPKGTTNGSIPCNIAWITTSNPEVESIYTWFAADPTLSV